MSSTTLCRPHRSVPGRAVVLQIPVRPNNYESPPSYTATMRLGLPIHHTNNRRIPSHIHDMNIQESMPVHMMLVDRFANRIQPSAPFYHRQPPPSYSESEFGYNHRVAFRRPSVDSICSMQELGREPVFRMCPACGCFSQTQTRRRCTRQAHATCLALCLCGCWPCMWVPYVMRECKETRHYCAICRNMIGVFNPWDIPDNFPRRGNVCRDRVRRTCSLF